MTKGLIFWVMMLLWLVFAVAQNWGNNFATQYGPWGNTVFLFILFLLLGWGVFGAPIR